MPASSLSKRLAKIEATVVRGTSTGARSIASRFLPMAKRWHQAAGVESVKLWDVASTKEKATLRGHRSTSPRWHSDRKVEHSPAREWMTPSAYGNWLRTNRLVLRPGVCRPSLWRVSLTL
jgi:hypothetical protein